MKIKAVIFDFGNVLIDLHYDRFFENFESLVGDLFSGEAYPPQILDHLIKYEKGLISDDAFIWYFQQINPRVQPRKLVEAWNSMLGEIPMTRLDMLVQLNQKFNVYLLSNTNNFHIRSVRQYLVRTHSIQDFEDSFFDKVYYSHEIKMRKPDREIYNYVLEDIGLSGSEILFIDDRVENVEAARKACWRAVLHKPEEDIIDCIDNYLNEYGS